MRCDSMRCDSRLYYCPVCIPKRGSEMPTIYSFPRPRLPPELTELIIDHLHDDIESLGSCSLVCKTWTRCARFHLFSELVVHGLEVTGFLESEWAPAVIPFIRRLHLDQQQWQHWNETLPLLVGFERIRSLTATNFPVCQLGAQALSALFRNFSAAVDVRLENVSFASTDQLVRFICAFPRLERVAVHCAIWCRLRFNPSTPTTFNLSPHLRVLELDSICMDTVLLWFLSLPNRPALRAVGLHPRHENNSETIASLVSALENSLESLLISTAIAQGSHWQLDLRRHARLRSLQIELNNADDTRLVTQMLSQISSTCIEEVGLEIKTGAGEEVGQIGWDEIDVALQQPLFSRLKTVTVRVVRLDTVDDWIPKAVEWVVDHMPLCDLRGILRVCEKDWRYRYSYFLGR